MASPFILIIYLRQQRKHFTSAPDLFMATYWGLAIKNSLRMYKVASCHPSENGVFYLTWVSTWISLSLLQHMKMQVFLVGYSAFAEWFFFFKKAALIKMLFKFRKHVTHLFSFFHQLILIPFTPPDWIFIFQNYAKVMDMILKLFLTANLLFWGIFLDCYHERVMGPYSLLIII